MALSDYVKRGQIGPSHKSSFYTYERNGRWVVVKWPKKRGKPRSEAQALTQTVFKAVCDAIKNTAAEIQTFHRENAKGTPMLPRDTLMAALYGNGPTVTFYSGKVIKPMANRLLASTVLDALAWEEGTLLYRGPDYWEAVPPAADGQVLSYSDELKRPVWVEAGGGGFGKPGLWIGAGSTNTGLQKFKGNIIQPLIAVTLEAVWFASWTNRQSQIKGLRIVFIDAANQITSLEYDDAAVYTSTGDMEMVRVPLSVPVNVPAGQKVGIFLYAADGISTTACGVYTGPQISFNFPLGSGVRRVAHATADMSVGFNVGAGSVEAWCIGLECA